jgi:hypothetical protein
MQLKVYRIFRIIIFPYCKNALVYNAGFAVVNS